MTTLRHEIRIDAPADRVWQAIAGDLTAVQHYNQQVASAKLLGPQRDGVGAARRCELKPKGFVEERVWEWSPKKAIGLEVSASEWPIVFMKWKTSLSEEGGATVVSQEMEYKLKFGPLGALMNALVMRRKLDTGIRDVFAALKRYVENGASR
jgi:ligand-binding SRPBCC domain-containing protein